MSVAFRPNVRLVIGMAAAASLLLAFGAAGQPSDPAGSDGVRGPAGSDLAKIPLESLAATRERPLFTPSRRQPMTAPVATPSAAPSAPAAAVSEPPRLTLVGIIVTPGGGPSAVVVDDTDHTSHSLRPGDNRRGWVVQSIEASTVTLKKQQETATLQYRKTETPEADPGVDQGIQE